MVYFPRGLKEMETELIFDLDECVQHNRKVGKFCIIGGIFATCLAGLGIPAIVLGVIWLNRPPESFISDNFFSYKKYIEKASQKTGKPVYYINLPPNVFGKYPTKASSPTAGTTPISSTPVTIQPSSQSKLPNYCETCGSQLIQGQKFCGKCGATITK